jgi:hypothetical protein
MYNYNNKLFARATKHKPKQTIQKVKQKVTHANKQLDIEQQLEVIIDIYTPIQRECERSNTTHIFLQYFRPK